MRDEAQVVIVGGGAMGVGLLYFLAHEGWTDTVLVEKDELTSGSTWHAAGLVSRMIGGQTLGKMHDYAVDLYQRIEAETHVKDPRTDFNSRSEVKAIGAIRDTRGLDVTPQCELHDKVLELDGLVVEPESRLYGEGVAHRTRLVGEKCGVGDGVDERECKSHPKEAVWNPAHPEFVARGREDRLVEAR